MGSVTLEDHSFVRFFHFSQFTPPEVWIRVGRQWKEISVSETETVAQLQEICGTNKLAKNHDLKWHIMALSMLTFVLRTLLPAHWAEVIHKND